MRYLSIVKGLNYIYIYIWIFNIYKKQQYVTRPVLLVFDFICRKKWLGYLFEIIISRLYNHIYFYII
jgi:hypothetical protein